MINDLQRTSNSFDTALWDHIGIYLKYCTTYSVEENKIQLEFITKMVIQNIQKESTQSSIEMKELFQLFKK